MCTHTELTSQKFALLRYVTLCYVLSFPDVRNSQAYVQAYIHVTLCYVVSFPDVHMYLTSLHTRICQCESALSLTSRHM